MSNKQTYPIPTPQDRPLLISRYVELNPPSLADNTADLDRLLRALADRPGQERVTVAPDDLNRFSALLRRADWKTTAALADFNGQYRLIDLKPGRRTDCLGLALDLGTTTLAAELIRLPSGRIEAEATAANPQVEFGSDVLTRIHLAGQGQLERLTEAMVRGVNDLIDRLLAQAGADRADLLAAAAAGNTIMTHFFMGLDPTRINREPYIPVINRPGVVPAGSLGLNLTAKAPVFLFPNVGSYFGGDLIAGLISSGMAGNEKTSLLVDVGTNAEVAVGGRDWLIACAGAAGPALEGGVAKMGMAAADGVIERVRIDKTNLEPIIEVIGQGPPRGLCGSGLIDLAAELFTAGVIDIQGKIKPLNHPRIKRTEDGWAYVLVRGGQDQPEVALSQLDMDILLRSKAAMYTILRTLISQIGLHFKDIDKIYVAGTFGRHIDPEQAVRLGMIPDLPRDHYISLGNSSLAGCRQALTEPAVLREADQVRDRITYLELNVNQEFMNRFSAAKFIPHTDRSRFPSVPPPTDRPESLL